MVHRYKHLPAFVFLKTDGETGKQTQKVVNVLIFNLMF